MSEERRSALMDLYRAFNGRDADAALNHLAPEVDWPNAATGGRERGRSAVRDYWEKQWQEIDPRVEPAQIEFDSEGRAHVRVHQLVTSRAGAVLQDRWLEHIYTFEGPFISRMDIIEADPDPDVDEDEEDAG